MADGSRRAHQPGSPFRPGADRPSLPGAVERVLRKGRRANADVLLVRTAEGPLVVKDYAARAGWVRRSVGRWLCAHEQAVYRAIEERLGTRPHWLPRLEGAIDDLAFGLAYRPGRPLSRSLADELGDDFILELDRAVQALHGAGIVHLDLRHRSNVLADADGRPVVLDFASAIRVPTGGWRHRLLKATLAQIDRRAVEKWRRKLANSPGDPV